MSRKAQNALPLDDRARYANRARFLEEVSHGVTRLLRGSNKNQAWLARRLGCSPARVSNILEGSHNFTLETLADIGLAFGRASHLAWGSDVSEMRFPTDENDAIVRVEDVAENEGVLAKILPGDSLKWRKTALYSGTVAPIHFFRTSNIGFPVEAELRANV